MNSNNCMKCIAPMKTWGKTKKWNIFFWRSICFTPACWIYGNSMVVHVHEVNFVDYATSSIIGLELRRSHTAQKMKFSIKDFFSKCDEIRSFLRTWSHLLKKSLMENFIFCAVHNFFCKYEPSKNKSTRNRIKFPTKTQFTKIFFN